MAVARAVFAAGGKLVFGAHPSISPLIASVLGEYSMPEAPATDENGEPRQQREGECQPCVEMYQSKVWEPLWAEDSRRLTERPQVGIRWVPAVGDETASSIPTAKPQAPRSMKEMRLRMIRESRPVAMIAIGGMEGTQEEAEIFAELLPGHPIYALSTTGGAARLIAERRHIRDNRIIVLDERARDDVMNFWKEQENRDPRRPKEQDVREGSSPAALREHHYYVPYSFIAQQIVAEIAESNEGQSETVQS